MPDFRQKLRISQMLRHPHRVNRHVASMTIAVSEQHKFMIERIIEISNHMVTTQQVKNIYQEAYGNEGKRLEKLRDDAVITINEICSLHPAYRKKLNQAIKKTIQ